MRARAVPWCGPGAVEKRIDVTHVVGVRAGLPRRLAVLITAVVAAVVLAPPTAWAHSQLLATTPAASAIVTAPAGEVTLTFNEPVHQRFSLVVVTGPGAVSYSNGHVQVVDDVVHQPVYPLRSGSYTVQWRVVSADGHPVEGRFGFTVALPPQLEPSAGPPSPSPSRLAASTGQQSGRWWPWLLGLGVVVIGAIAMVGIARRRRS
jgi:methionine-rich copper-binding protein CopC